MVRHPEKVMSMSDEFRRMMKDNKIDDLKAEDKQKKFKEIINEAAETHLTPKETTKKKDYIMDETYERILNKENFKKEGKWRELETESGEI